MAEKSKADMAEIVRISDTLIHVVRLETDYPRVGIIGLVIAAVRCAAAHNMERQIFEDLVRLAAAIGYKDDEEAIRAFKKFWRDAGQETHGEEELRRIRAEIERGADSADLRSDRDRTI